MQVGSTTVEACVRSTGVYSWLVRIRGVLEFLCLVDVRLSAID